MLGHLFLAECSTVFPVFQDQFLVDGQSLLELVSLLAVSESAVVKE